ncbi:MAG: DNA methyltransferase [Candidatus Aminicenantes bacterium]|jgi:DNA modification methylase
MNPGSYNAIIPNTWEGSCLASESTLHQIAPYIGKMKSTMARTLIKAYSSPGDMVCDPFVGSGVVALECLISGRGVKTVDINPYAITLTMAKLYPPRTMEEALEKTSIYLKRIELSVKKVALDNIPGWIKDFFHPRTLKEVIALFEILRQNKEYFLLACLLGILHHQRPGFLSYPASHLVPYLLTRKFPKGKFPELYEYRAVAPRLKKKVQRTYRRFPDIDQDVPRECKFKDAANLNLPKDSIDVVITSPPYMNALDYVRDNRLRLWFLGITEYIHYDRKSVNNCQKFLNLMERCLRNIKHALRSQGRCILVIGEVKRSKKSINTAQLIIDLAVNKIGGFKCEDIIEDTIPDIRRARKNGACTKQEWIVVLRKGEK